MKTIFNVAVHNIKNFTHRALLQAYIHSRNYWLRVAARPESDGEPFTAFGPGPKHPLP